MRTGHGNLRSVGNVRAASAMIAARGKKEMLCTRHEHTVDPSVATQERIAPFEKPLISGSPVEALL